MVLKVKVWELLLRCFNEQLDTRCSPQTYHRPISHTIGLQPSPHIARAVITRDWILGTCTYIYLYLQLKYLLYLDVMYLFP